MDDHPVKVGRMLFTMVDPHRGHEVAYNRWYERDHFYAGCMIGPWLFAGRRWVAPRALKDLRFPDSSPVASPVDAGSYLSIYWVHKDHEDEHFAWASAQVRWLYQNGRGFNERTHAHTCLYDFLSADYADDDGVPVELALDHSYEGLGVVFVEPISGNSRDDLQEWLAGAGEAVSSLLRTGAVATVSTWAMHPRPEPNPAQQAPMSLGADGGRDDRLLQLCFLESDPQGGWEAFRQYGKAVEAGGVGRVTFAAPFLPTVVGTDHYTDQLW